MDFSSISEKDIIAGGFAGIGGLLRILLNVDPDIPKKTQFALLFFAALPVGWFVYNIAVFYEYHVFAFPAGFFSGIMALSIVSIVARDGAGTLLAMLKRGGKDA